MSVHSLFAQNTDNIIKQVAQNNPTLKALSKSNAADSAGNRTGMFLPNPEIGFNYLFGSPSAIGKRKDFSIVQSFDFPTAYIYKNQISGIKNQQLQYAYQQTYKSIVLETKLICIDLIYYNLLIKEYSQRMENAQKIATSFKAKFDIGEANILEYNKAQLNKLNAEKELQTLEIEKEALLNELAGLNGNIAVTFTDTVFPEIKIPADFEQWYAEAENRNPVLHQLKLEAELSEKHKSLAVAEGWPKFSAGYMSEFTAGENFQGITLGISIPLWENKNKVKYSKLKTEAIQKYENASKLTYYNSLKRLHAKAVALQKNVNEYEENLQTFNNSDLLYKALDKGEIDLINYIMELSFYYESSSNLLEMKLELHKTLAKLFQY